MKKLNLKFETAKSATRESPSHRRCDFALLRALCGFSSACSAIKSFSPVSNREINKAERPKKIPRSPQSPAAHRDIYGWADNRATLRTL